MSDDIICFMNDFGFLSMVIPTQSFIDNAGDIHQHAREVVPSGKSYIIKKRLDFPNDRNYRHAWIIDENQSVIEDLTKCKQISVENFNKNIDKQMKNLSDQINLSSNLDETNNVNTLKIQLKSLIDKKNQFASDLSNFTNVDDLKKFISSSLSSSI